MPHTSIIRHTSVLKASIALALFVSTASGIDDEVDLDSAFETIQTWQELVVEDTPLAFQVIEPVDLDRAAPVPVLIAFPPGAETKDMVTAGMGLYWKTLAASGWVVISPAPRAFGGASASRGDGARFITLLEWAAERYNMEGGRPHLAGISNGGRGAFHLAGMMPKQFLSLTCLPGMPPESTPSFEALASLPVALFTGENDAPWVAASRTAQMAIRNRGGACTLTIVPGEGHVISPSSAAPIFSHFRSLRAQVLEQNETKIAISRELDDLHKAAAEADEQRYFDHFSPTQRGPVFIGTDATERWSLPEFRAFAHPYFEAGKVWTYTPISRHIELDQATSDLAWFDETLAHETYGTVRGSGVLVRRAKRWRVAQYVLSFPIPNQAADEVLERIRASNTPASKDAPMDKSGQ